MLIKVPMVFPGQRIGLLGGSFDPPHAGHLHISRRALRAIGLDQVWWLVSPGNPLKTSGPADIDRRMAACRDLIDHPRIMATDVERHLPNAFTANTLMHLIDRHPAVRFVWLMGADNLATFHLWENWRWIIETVPIAVFARPGQQVRAGLSPAARVYDERRLPPQGAKLLGHSEAPHWVLLPGPMSDQSSTALRAGGAWRVTS